MKKIYNFFVIFRMLWMTASHPPLQTWKSQLEIKPVKQKEMAQREMVNGGMTSKEEGANSSTFLRTQ